MLRQEYETSQTERAAQPIGSSQPPCTSKTTRRGKTVVPTMERAIVIMEANKKKRKKPDWQKY